MGIVSIYTNNSSIYNSNYTPNFCINVQKNCKEMSLHINSHFCIWENCGVFYSCLYFLLYFPSLYIIKNQSFVITSKKQPLVPPKVV